MTRFFLRSVILVVVCSAEFSFGQKEANSWYFAWQVAVDFNTGSPVAVNNSGMSQYEGCSAISDKNTGAILIYSDGQEVFGSDHLIMPNGSGLTGDESGAQSALIVPMPGSSTQYYIFVASEYFSGGISGYTYSIVDLTLNGGIGDVTAIKNVLLYSPGCEKMACVKNSTGTGYWLATHEFTGNNFVMFEITAAGISAPHVVPCGTIYSSTEPIGCMKFSPDGSKLATVLSGQNLAEIYDFDASTGDVSNPLTIGPVASNLYVYGISFSPNGDLLYVSEENSNFLSQFDVTLGSAAAITASKVSVGTTSQSAFQTLQLAPDGKLYCTNNGSFYLGVVNDPDIYGAGCNYVDQGFYLDGLNVGYGLPGFVENLFMDNVPPVPLFSAPNHICPGTCTDFVNLSQNATSYIWNFAGANPSVSTDVNPTGICYNTPGSYSVELIATNAVTSDTLTLNNYITVYPYPAPQGILQSGDTLIANQGASAYQWYFEGVLIPGATDYFYVAPEGGNYNVVCTDENGCEVEAVINDVVAGLSPALSEGEAVTAFPNPVGEKLEIRFGNIESGEMNIVLFNASGQKVLTETHRGVNKNNHLVIDLRNFSAAIYWIEITTGNNVFRSKFLKK
jgi:PKD repeat protein